MTAGLVLALAAAVGYGASDFVGGLASRRSSSWPIVVSGQGAGALLMLAWAIVQPGRPEVAHFAWAALAGLGGGVGGIFLYRGLARGKMGVVAPVSGIGAAILPVIVAVARGERPSTLVWLGVVVALPGIWLVSQEAGSDSGSRQRGAMLDGALAGVGFGLLFIALGQIPHSAGTLPLAANQAVGAALAVAVAISQREQWLPGREARRWGAAAGLLGVLASMAFLVAGQTANLTLAAVLASLYPAVTVVLAALVLHERVRPGQRLGLLVCTAAVGLVAAG